MSDHASNLSAALKAEKKLAKLLAKHSASLAKAKGKYEDAIVECGAAYDSTRAEFLASLAPEVSALISGTHK